MGAEGTKLDEEFVKMEKVNGARKWQRRFMGTVTDLGHVVSPERGGNQRTADRTAVQDYRVPAAKPR